MQVISQLKVLMREEASAEKFDREAWTHELAPIMAQWQKLNQVYKALIACISSQLFAHIRDLTCLAPW